MRRIPFRILLLYIILGAVTGSLIGEFAGWILPEGVVREFFTRSVVPGFDPINLNLIIITLTFGFTFKLNISGLFGIIIAVYILKWYR
ncbi:MAG: DUF4321 domain-containing protein [bacterium]|nr:DUF4321 domain-containing protein [bacterium]